MALDRDRLVGYAYIGCQPLQDACNQIEGAELHCRKHGRIVTDIQAQLRGVKGKVNLVPNSTSSTALLQALGKVAVQEKLACTCDVIIQDTDVVIVRVSVVLPTSVWTHRGLKASPASIILLNALVPLSKAACDPRDIVEQSEMALKQDFSLTACFNELPTCQRDPELPPLIKAQPAALSSAGPQCSTTASSPSPTSLHELPHDVLAHVLSFLPLRDLISISCTCRFMRGCTSDVVPGLRLRLFPHQRTALRWMLHREVWRPEVPHPFMRTWTTQGGLLVYADLVNGTLRGEPPAPVPEIQGGFFCDEPGLGKTITAISLILRTKHKMPKPPPDVHVTWTRDQHGCLQGHYMLRTGRMARAASTGTTVAASSSKTLYSGLRSRSSISRTTLSEISKIIYSPRSASASLPAASSCTSPQHPLPASNHHSRKSAAAAAAAEPTSPNFTCQRLCHQQHPTCSPSTATPCSHTSQDIHTTAQQPGMVLGMHLPEPMQVDDAAASQQGALPGCLAQAAAAPAAAQAEAPCAAACSVAGGSACQTGAEEDGGVPLGYLQSGELPEHPRNVDHLRGLLAQHPQLVASAVHWLTGVHPDDLHKGALVPNKERQPELYWQLFELLGLESQVPQSPSEAYTAQNTWKQRPDLQHFTFDGDALAVALRPASEDDAQRVYLSRATLVVVPSTMPQHWLHQVEMHVGPGCLRMHVYQHSSREPDPHQAQELAWDYDLVITTFDQLTNDWNRSQEEAGGNVLLKVHWQRIVLDEGHKLGALQETNRQKMAGQLRAQCRWVMTGTPTPSTSHSNVSSLQPLLAFLRHAPYGTNHRLFQFAIQKPLSQRRPEGRARLVELLRSCMIRASKDDICLPRLSYKVTRLDFAPEHACSYNELVEVVRRNLLLADWYDQDHNESLLHERQKEWSRELLKNVRLSCCVAGHVSHVVKEEDVLETLQLLAERLGLPAPDAGGPPWTPWDHPLHGVEEGLRSGTDCIVCGAFTAQPMVTPCSHMTCLDCIATSRTCCPLPSCRTPYKMQAVDDPARKRHNAHPKWPVPIELIEWQPVYHQRGALGLSGGNWAVKWETTKSTRCVHLIKRLYEIGAVPHLGAAAAHGSHRLGHSEHHDGPHVAAAAGNGNGILKRGPAITKAIVFAQFQHHIFLIWRHLNEHGINYVTVRKGDRQQAALNRFVKDPGCSVLVMDDTGALGLDLSFVSYIFLMEPIPDRSLEQQVISRAWRLGAQQTVHVELLVMRGTAEEDMVQLAASTHLSTSEQVAAAAATDAAATAGATLMPTAAAGQAAALAAAAGSATGMLSPSSASCLSLQAAQPLSAASASALQPASSSSSPANSSATVGRDDLVSGTSLALDTRPMRNLVFLHLRKVAVADLREYEDYDAASSWQIGTLSNDRSPNLKQPRATGVGLASATPASAIIASSSTSVAVPDGILSADGSPNLQQLQPALPVSASKEAHESAVGAVEGLGTFRATASAAGCSSWAHSPPCHAGLQDQSRNSGIDLVSLLHMQAKKEPAKMVHDAAKPNPRTGNRSVVDVSSICTAYGDLQGAHVAVANSIMPDTAAGSVHAVDTGKGKRVRFADARAVADANLEAVTAAKSGHTPLVATACDVTTSHGVGVAGRKRVRFAE